MALKPSKSADKWRQRRRLSLAQIFERAQLDWYRLVVTQESGVILEHEYPLSAKFFLTCAREDLKEGKSRGFVNALSNAKRAIDCQTDSYLCAIGFSPKTLQKQLGATVIQGLVQFSPAVDRPLKFRVLESLGIVAPAIVNRVRTIRHLLEHQYKKPTPAAVRDAIDIASLYVSALDGSMNSFLENVHLECGDIPHPLGGDTVAERRISIELTNWRDPDLFIGVRFWDLGKREEATLKILPSDPNYLSMLRVLFAGRARENFEEVLRFAAMNSGFSLGAKKIRVTEWRLG